MMYAADYVKCANCATLRPLEAMDPATHRVCADETWCDEVKRGARLPQGPKPIETFAEIFETQMPESPVDHAAFAKLLTKPPRTKRQTRARR